MKHVHTTIHAFHAGTVLCLFFVMVFIQVDSSIAGGAERDTSGYSEFADELREYIPNNIILGLLSKLPAGGSIYGYDIGDLTGNKKPDMVISLKKPDARWNDVFIYFFTTRDEGFELIKVITRRYNDEPLEVAFYIENGTCFVTDKVKDRHWRVDGYSIGAFVFRQVYHWTNHTLKGWTYGIQVDSDFREMKTTEIYYKSETLAPVLKNTFLTVPAYPAGMKIPRDLPYVVSDSASLMVLHGVSNWSGPDDCRLSVFARYDSVELTVSAIVLDDIVSGGGTADARDGVSFWFDCKGAGKLHYNQGAWQMREQYAPGTLGVTVAADSMGKFTRLRVRYSGFAEEQHRLLPAVQSSSVILKNGARMIRCSIPLAFFERESDTFGFAASYEDVDRLESVERTSLLATSRHFIEGLPFTYGLLRFLPSDRPPFERDDFRMLPLLKELTNAGVLPR